MKFIKGINFATFAKRGVLASAEARASLDRMLEDLACDFVMANDSPDDAAREACITLGKALA